MIQAVPGGSYLAICHLTADIYPEMTDAQVGAVTAGLREALRSLAA